MALAGSARPFSVSLNNQSHDAPSDERMPFVIKGPLMQCASTSQASAKLSVPSRFVRTARIFQSIDQG